MKRKKRFRPALPRFLTNVGGFVTAEGIRAWMRTLDYRAVFYDRSVDPVYGVDGSRIYVFWHERQFPRDRQTSEG